jgi:hypothetical protein
MAIAQTWDDPPNSKIRGLKHVNPCRDPSRGLLKSLSLGSWLDRFFDRLRRDRFNWKNACLSKITLNTQIVLLLDISAGVNPLIATTFILPVSGETFDYNPSATQSLQIVLQPNMAYENGKKYGTCEQSPAQPSIMAHG